jgi:hypothetical protein
MVKTSRSELEHIVSKVVAEVKFDREKVENVKRELLKYGVMRGKTQKIFNGEIGLEELDDRTLCLLIVELHNSTKLNIINPYQSYSVEEIEGYKKMKESTDEHSVGHIMFTNVVQHGENDYEAIENVKNLIKLYNESVLEYNYDITRNYKFSPDITGKLKRVLDVNMKDVKDTAHKILNNQYDISKIVINISDDASVSYDSESKKLSVTGGKTYIISGIYDLNALVYALEQNPDFSKNVQLEIKHYSKEQITKYYYQLKIKGGVR